MQATVSSDAGSQVPRILRAALWWAHRGAGIVPMRPSLDANTNGKLSPIPLIRWQKDGPLRDPRRIRDFWQVVPEAQLAILLENGLAAVDVDLKHLPGGRAPSEYPIPKGRGYRETTKSGGLHFVFRIRESLDSARPTRITGLGGYVDVFTGGLLVTAPSRFTNVGFGYELLCLDIPVFSTMSEALQNYSPWLPGAWEERWSRPTLTPTLPSARGSKTDSPVETQVDLAEVANVVRFIQGDPVASTVFERGLRHPDGTVDRSLTEFRLVSILKGEGISRETCWDIVRLCPHTKSPQDVRGWQRFERHVWARLP